MCENEEDQRLRDERSRSPSGGVDHRAVLVEFAQLLCELRSRLPDGEEKDRCSPFANSDSSSILTVGDACDGVKPSSCLRARGPGAERAGCAWQIRRDPPCADAPQGCGSRLPAVCGSACDPIRSSSRESLAQGCTASAAHLRAVTAEQPADKVAHAYAPDVPAAEPQPYRGGSLTSNSRSRRFLSFAGIRGLFCGVSGRGRGYVQRGGWCCIDLVAGSPPDVSKRVRGLSPYYSMVWMGLNAPWEAILRCAGKARRKPA